MNTMIHTTTRIGADAQTSHPSTAGVTTFRLHLLRATYILIFVGLGSDIWPAIFYHATPWTNMQGVAMSLLGAISAIAILGIRHPLQMLPLLLFELLWKAIWLIAVAWPLWSTQQVNEATMETIYACLLGMVIFPIVIPWRYVWAHYVKKPAEVSSL